MISSRARTIRASLSPSLQTAIEIFEDRHRGVGVQIVGDYDALKLQFLREKPHADLLHLLDPDVQSRVFCAIRAVKTTQYDREELRRLHRADETFLVESFGAKCLTNKTFLSELRGFFGDGAVAMTVPQKRDLILECARRRVDGEPGYSSQGVGRNTLLCCKDLRKAVAVAAAPATAVAATATPAAGQAPRGSSIETYKGKGKGRAAVEVGRAHGGGAELLDDYDDDEDTIELQQLEDALPSSPSIPSLPSLPSAPLVAPSPSPSPSPSAPPSPSPSPLQGLLLEEYDEPAAPSPSPLPSPPAPKEPPTHKARRCANAHSDHARAAASAAKEVSLREQLDELLAMKAHIGASNLPKALKKEMLAPLWAWMKGLEDDAL